MIRHYGRLAVPAGVLLALCVPMTRAAQGGLTGTVCVESVVQRNDSTPEASWKDNLKRDLNRPYSQMQVELKPSFNDRKVDGQSPALTIIQALATRGGIMKISKTEDPNVEIPIEVETKDSAADIAWKVAQKTSKDRVAVFGGSALLFRILVTTPVPGIQVTSAPQFDLKCNLTPAAATWLAAKSQCSADQGPMKMLVVPTEMVLCHGSASGYKSLKPYPAWVNTSFVSLNRTQSSAGTYRQYLPPHEIGHVLLDGGDPEVHSSDSNDLMHYTGGRGVMPRPVQRRIIKRSGPDAVSPLLSGAATVTARDSSLRRSPPRLVDVNGDGCPCVDTSVIRGQLRELLVGVEEPDFARVCETLVGFTLQADPPESAFPALVSIFDDEPAQVLRKLVRELIDRAPKPPCLEKTDSFGGGTEWEEATPRAVALLLRAAFASGFRCSTGDGSGLVSGFETSEYPSIRDAFAAARAAEAACQYWRTGKDAAESLTILESYIRQGFLLNTGEESLDLYGGGEPFVRWARRQFRDEMEATPSGARRARLRAVWEKVPEEWRRPVYRSYLEELAGLSRTD